MINRISTEKRAVVLTFDDGPDNHFTPLVLDILAQYGVKATFFCLGMNIEKNPEVFRRMVDEGHTVANHTWSHPDLTKISPEEITLEVQRTNDMIQKLSGKRSLLFRLPYLKFNDAVVEQLECMGYELVAADVDANDWAGIPGPKIAANVLPKLKSGSIILCHCAGNVAGTPDALPYIIEVAQGLGFEFATIQELLIL